jgi:hypothetical protein
MCAKHIATDAWHESLEEGRLLTVEEYRELAPSIAEEFVKRWLKEQGGGVCSQMTVNYLREDIKNAEICELAALDSAIIHSCHLCEDYDYDDGNQPPREKDSTWRDIPRHTHDDGFDEYDGDDEEWETESQEEERRQEMAEERERQEDAYDELNSEVSHSMPDNWLEIAMRE